MDEPLRIFLVPIVLVFAGWCLWIDRVNRHIKQVCDRLLDMHENPETTGFGTVGMEEVVKDNTKAIRGLSQMLRWFMEKQGGEKMPPFDGL